jgi:hypothetical protein
VELDLKQDEEQRVRKPEVEGRRVRGGGARARQGMGGRGRG